MLASVCACVHTFYVHNYLPACLVYVQMYTSTHARYLLIYSHAYIHAEIHVYHGMQRCTFACIYEKKSYFLFLFASCHTHTNSSYDVTTPSRRALSFSLSKNNPRHDVTRDKSRHDIRHDIMRDMVQANREPN